jgi:preprotein translocase subunit SecA
MQNEASRLLNIQAPVAQWALEEGIGEEDIEVRLRDMADSYMAAKKANITPDIMRRVEKAILLQQLDTQWKDHLLNMDYLRQGISLRAFAQRDPLNEYKAEAFAYFQDMLNRLRENVTMTLAMIDVDPDQGSINLMPKANFDSVEEQHQEFTSPQESEPEAPKTVPFKKDTFDQANPATWDNVPRNALCPCGSGKKYKHCHGDITKARHTG